MPVRSWPRADRQAAAPPSRAAFTDAEWALVRRLRTPAAVQRYLNTLPYNTEPRGETLRTFRGVVTHGEAHCLEAAIFAAVVLEQHGYPPLVLSFESVDLLDHVLYVYRTPTGWGSIGRSRDPGLHGRLPVFRTARALAASYLEAYVDMTGRIRAYAVADLRAVGRYDWRFSERNVWKVEQMLIDFPHRRLTIPDARYRTWHRRYRQFRQDHPDDKPVACLSGRAQWSPLPPEWAASLRRQRRTLR